MSCLLKQIFPEELLPYCSWACNTAQPYKLQHHQLGTSGNIARRLQCIAVSLDSSLVWQLCDYGIHWRQTGAINNSTDSIALDYHKDSYNVCSLAAGIACIPRRVYIFGIFFYTVYFFIQIISSGSFPFNYKLESFFFLNIPISVFITVTALTRLLYKKREGRRKKTIVNHLIEKVRQRIKILSPTEWVSSSWR